MNTLYTYHKTKCVISLFFVIQFAFFSHIVQLSYKHKSLLRANQMIQSDEAETQCIRFASRFIIIQFATYCHQKVFSSIYLFSKMWWQYIMFDMRVPNKHCSFPRGPRPRGTLLNPTFQLSFLALLL